MTYTPGAPLSAGTARQMTIFRFTRELILHIVQKGFGL